MKTYEYSFGAGETKVFPGGTFFVLITATSGVDVQYLKNNTSLNEDAINVTSGYEFDYEEGFNFVKVTSAIAQTVKVAVSRGNGTFNVTSNNITGGLIDTVNEVGSIENMRPINKKCFANGYYCEALAGNYSNILIANYSDTTSSELVLKSLKILTTNDATFDFSMGLGYHTGNTWPTFASGYRREKYSASSASDLNALKGHDVVAYGNGDMFIPANQYVDLVERDPFIIKSGWGMQINCRTANTGLYIIFDHEDHPL